MAVLDPGVDGVHARVGGRPGQLVGAAHGDKRQPRNRPRDQERLAQLQHRLVPDGGKPVGLKVRIAGQDRVAAGGPARRDCPVVGGDRRRDPGLPAHAFRNQPLAQPQLLDQGDVQALQQAGEQLLQVPTRHARLHQLHHEPLHFGLVLSQLDVPHHPHQRHRVRRRPRLRPVAHHPQLPGPPLFQRLVDPATVRLEQRSAVRGQLRYLRLGGAVEVEPPEEAVEAEQLVAGVEDLRCPPTRQYAHQQQLKAPVGAVAVTKPPKQVGLTLGTNMGHPVTVPGDVDSPLALNAGGEPIALQHLAATVKPGEDSRPYCPDRRPPDHNEDDLHAF